MRPTHALTLATFLVCAGRGYAQEPYDQTFSPDVEVPEGFRANRTSYSAIMDVLAPSRPDGHNIFGDMGATGIQMRGAAGVVVDGGMRDYTGLQDSRFEGFPVLHRFSDPHTSSWLGVEYNTPVRIGGVTVMPGDIVIGDDGGVFFFPPELLDQVLEYAAESAAREEFQLELLFDRRYRFRDVYPLSPELMEEFERTRR